MKQEKQKPDIARTLLVTPVDEILDDDELMLVGATEKERQVNLVRFTRLRNIAHRYAQTLTADDNETIIAFLKTTVVQKGSPTE
jgi:ABC-type transport system involved in Fe-S cluster assembly fused permease/ATPase subunit